MAALPMTCREVLDLLTDYLESALPTPIRARLEQHLAECDHCAADLDQLRATIDALGSLPEEEVAPEVRERLLVLFRSWHRADV